MEPNKNVPLTIDDAKHALRQDVYTVNNTTGKWQYRVAEKNRKTLFQKIKEKTGWDFPRSRPEDHEIGNEAGSCEMFKEIPLYIKNGDYHEFGYMLFSDKQTRFYAPVVQGYDYYRMNALLRNSGVKIISSVNSIFEVETIREPNVVLDVDHKQVTIPMIVTAAQCTEFTSVSPIKNEDWYKSKLWLQDEEFISRMRKWKPNTLYANVFKFIKDAQTEMAKNSMYKQVRLLKKFRGSNDDDKERNQIILDVIVHKRLESLKSFAHREPLYVFEDQLVVADTYTGLKELDIWLQPSTEKVIYPGKYRNFYASRESKDALRAMALLSRYSPKLRKTVFKENGENKMLHIVCLPEDPELWNSVRVELDKNNKLYQLKKRVKCIANYCEVHKDVPFGKYLGFAITIFLISCFAYYSYVSWIYPKFIAHGRPNKSKAWKDTNRKHYKNPGQKPRNVKQNQATYVTQPRNNLEEYKNHVM
jgi:hypothetical protein